MDAVQKRVADRMRVERKELQDEQMRLGKRRVALAKEVASAIAAESKVIDLLEAAKMPKPGELAKAHTARKRIASAVRELEQNTARTNVVSARLEAIKDGKELERRMKLAAKLGVDDPVPGPEAARVVLLNNGKPMTVTDISRTMLETGIVKLSGRTPVQTISAYLAKAARKGDTFVRVDPATYDLKDRPSPAPAKPAAKPASGKGSAKKAVAKS